MHFVIFTLCLMLITNLALAKLCDYGLSLTTFTGTHAPKESVCSGDLIFEDSFNSFDLRKWEHEITLTGGGQWEFQWYVNNRSNSFTKDGILHIRPTLTSEFIGEEALSSATVDIRGGNPAGECTSDIHDGCKRTGTPVSYINPIRSARIRTVKSFNFKYGVVEVMAKLPAGDWLWPAIWLLPETQQYGQHPSSGEIDIMESRGNRKLFQNGVNIGSEQIAATLHWGPNSASNRWRKTHFTKNTRSDEGFDTDFHKFRLEWAPDYLNFFVDEEHIGKVQPNMSFWDFGEFDSMGLANPWKYNEPNAPFDQEFYLTLNLAVGGISGYFPDYAQNPKPKPWKTNSPTAMRDFWHKKEDWMPTWNMNENEGETSSFLIDYVRVWAL